MAEMLAGAVLPVAVLSLPTADEVVSGLLVGLAAGLLLMPRTPRPPAPSPDARPRPDARPGRRRRASALGRPRRSTTMRTNRRPSDAAWGTASGAPPDAAPDGVPDAALLVDLVSALLSAGSGIEASLDRLSRTVPGAEPLSAVHRALAVGADWDEAWAELSNRRGGAGSARRGRLGALAGRRGLRGVIEALPRGRRGVRARSRALRAVGEQLTFAHGTGAPSTELLQIGAERLRAARRHAAEQQVARLSVRMVLPLGLCFLPAFILLGVMPVVLGLLPQVLDGALGG